MYEADKARQFLMRLNDDQYSTVRSQILVLDLLPLLGKIFKITQQEKSHKKLMIAQDTQGEMGMAFETKELGHMVKKGACKICGWYGHEENVCYEVIGCPPHWGSHG